MTVTFRIVASFCFLFVFLPTLAAKPWHGLTPGKSTREDVARELKQQVGDGPKFNYQTATADIVFVFSPLEGYRCLPDLPSGTLLEIIIHPRVQLSLDELELRKDNLKELNIPGYIIDGKGVIDEEEGLVIKTSGGAVREIVYTAEESDRRLCEEYYGSLGRFADSACNFTCLTVTVSCPDEVEEGQMVTFSANVAVGDPIPPLTYTWTVTGGKIVEGQGTESIKVDSKGLRGQTITATVDVGGGDPACNHTASCSAIITRKP